eukprot:2263837-Pleurochrysis_carterae.AAC.2
MPPQEHTHVQILLSCRRYFSLSMTKFVGWCAPSVVDCRAIAVTIEAVRADYALRGQARA